MDYPHGHHNTRHQQPSPPPPQVHHTSHVGPEKPHAPVYTVNDPHPPQVQHTSHTGPAPNTHHTPAPPHVPSYSPPPPAAADPHHRPQAPSASSHDTHNKTDELAKKPSVRMFCKAETNFSLTIRDGKVVLAPSNSADPHQVGSSLFFWFWIMIVKIAFLFRLRSYWWKWWSGIFFKFFMLFWWIGSIG